MADSQIADALQKFNSSLPKPAKWIVLLKRDGGFLSRVGEYMTYLPPPLKDELVAFYTHAHAMAEIEMLDGLKHGTFQYSISIGSKGIYIIVNLNDTYILGISYQWSGVRSFDETIEAILANFMELL